MVLYIIPYEHCWLNTLSREVLTIETFAQGQAKNLLDISMEINTAVYEETHASEILNHIVTEYKEITLNINAIVDVVQQMANAINSLAVTASETA